MQFDDLHPGFINHTSLPPPDCGGWTEVVVGVKTQTPLPPTDLKSLDSSLMFRFQLIESVSSRIWV